MKKHEMENFLINYLLQEINASFDFNDVDKFKLFRGLVNKREPKNISKEFIEVQDKYLTLLLKEKGITDYKKYVVEENIFLVKADITTINTDCIVNAANNYLLGCFIPNHGCIDNAIHTYSGVQLRLDCNEIMAKQKHLEETGVAKITNSYNLPCKKVIHTVGPIVHDKLTDDLRNDLKRSYENVLKIAVENKMKSIALCCISTGEFRFPKYDAAVIAIETSKEFLKNNNIDIVFNVFGEEDYEIYRRLLKN